MADNVTLNSMSGGAVVATDDTGTSHVQIVKLAISADGSATFIPADATYGIDVDVTRLPALVLAAGGNTIGAVTQASGPWTVIERGANIDSTSVSVTTSNTAVVASASDRRSVTVQNLGTDYVYLGKTGVAANTGVRLAPGQTFVMDKSPNAALYGLASSGTQTVSIFIEKD